MSPRLSLRCIAPVPFLLRLAKAEPKPPDFTAEQLWASAKHLRKDARDAIKAGDVAGFFCRADSMLSMRMLLDNEGYFRHHELWERALLFAWQNQKVTGHAKMGTGESWATLMPALLASCDRAKLLAASDSLPDGDIFTIYRGTQPEFVRNVSWTLDVTTAAKFPQYCSSASIYSTTVKRSDVYAYLDRRHEKEVLVVLDIKHPVTLVRVNGRGGA